MSIKTKKFKFMLALFEKIWYYINAFTKKAQEMIFEN